MAARTLLIAYGKPSTGGETYEVWLPAEITGGRRPKSLRVEAGSLQEAYSNIADRIPGTRLLTLVPDHAYLWPIVSDRRLECLPACRVFGETLGVEACPSWQGDWCTLARASLETVGSTGDYVHPVPERTVIERGATFSHGPGPGSSQYYSDWSEGVAIASILEALHYAEQELGGPVEAIVASPETPQRARPIQVAVALYSLSLAADEIHVSPTLYLLSPGRRQHLTARVKYTPQSAYSTIYQYSLPARNLAMGGESPLSKAVTQRVAKLVASAIPSAARGEPVPGLVALLKSEETLAASSADACKAPVQARQARGGWEIEAPQGLEGQIGLLAPVYVSLAYARLLRRGLAGTVRVEERRGRLILVLRDSGLRPRVLPEPGRTRFTQWVEQLWSEIAEAIARAEPSGSLSASRRRLELEIVERKLQKQVERILSDPSS